MKRWVIFGLILLFLGLTSATQTCQVYDYFSSGSLNLSKWYEYSNINFSEEHFVDQIGEVYHVQQNIIGSSETNLQLKMQFNTGDVLSYDAIYVSGVGNRASQPLINGNYPPTQIEPCLASAGCGVIGFWNGVPDLQAQPGIYNIKFEFFHNQVKMTTIRPDNVTIINTFTGNSEPYNLTINTHTGHNGTMHFDYDNFVLCKEVNLEERISTLESWKEIVSIMLSNIWNSINTLITENDEQDIKMDALGYRITALENQTPIIINNSLPNYFKYLSSSDRKKMVCGYAEDMHLTQLSDLGWNCDITYRQTSSGEKSSCKCKKIE